MTLSSYFYKLPARLTTSIHTFQQKFETEKPRISTVIGEKKYNSLKVNMDILPVNKSTSNNII